MTDIEAPEEDMIDEALLALIHEVIGDVSEDEAEDALDEAGDFIFDVIDDMVDEGEISEVPDNREPDEMKQDWIQKCLPLVRERVAAIMTDPEGESEEDGDTDLA